jgi:hypothetical protein
MVALWQYNHNDQAHHRRCDRGVPFLPTEVLGWNHIGKGRYWGR